MSDWFMFFVSFFLFIAIGIISATEYPVDLPVIPAVQSWESHSGEYIFNTLLYNGLDEEYSQRLEQSLIELGQVTTVEKVSQVSESNLEFMIVKLDKPALKDYQREAYYEIEISRDKITIRAEKVQGFFNALMTLRQLLVERKQVLPQGIIRDYPVMEFRGISDDISRGQVSTLTNFKEIIRFCGLFKLNYYFLYLEDVVQLAAFPSFGKARGRLTAAEIRELDAYAQGYFVTIVPVFQTLGHWENILMEEEYEAMAEFPGAASLAVGEPETYLFLEKAIAEVCQMFSSPWFHIGADESFDVGKGRSASVASRKGVGQLHLEHYNRVFELVRRQGKKIMMYSDIVQKHPEIWAALPQDVMMVYWAYSPRIFYEYTEKFEMIAQPYIVSSAVWNWRRFYPAWNNAVTNIYNFTRDGFEHNARGSIISGWGDFGGANLRESDYFGYGWGADCAWNPLNANLERFESIFWWNWLADPMQQNSWRQIHHLLTLVGESITFKELFQFPYQPDRFNYSGYMESNAQSYQLLGLSDNLLLLCPEGSSIHRADYIRWVAKIARFYANEQLLMVDFHRLKSFHFLNTDYKIKLAELSPRAMQLKEELVQLKNEYQQLWLQTNREENLSRLMKEFDYALYYLDLFGQLAMNGRSDFSGSLPGSFITLDSDQKSEAAYPRLFYRYNLYLEDEIPSSLIVELIAQGIANFWINGRHVGEVITHHTLSLKVEQSRIKVFDLKPYLRKGVNRIAIAAESFRNDCPSVYFFGEWLDRSGTRNMIRSGAEWRVASKSDSGWQTGDQCFERWQFAREIPPYENFSRPFLIDGFPSRVER